MVEAEEAVVVVAALIKVQTEAPVPMAVEAAEGGDEVVVAVAEEEVHQCKLQGGHLMQATWLSTVVANVGHPIFLIPRLDRYLGPASTGPSTPRGGGRGYDSYRGRGRGREFMDDVGLFSPGGYGRGGRGRGRGRGATPVRMGGDESLSTKLQNERPFLKPIVFVPSVLTRVLFQEEDEIFQPVVEETGALYFLVILKESDVAKIKRRRATYPPPTECSECSIRMLETSPCPQVLNRKAMMMKTS